MASVAGSVTARSTATRAFAAAAWCTLGWNLLVILWGAYVRASGSGAGCGGHWPLCNGQVVPSAPQGATIIEYAHRLSSGVALIAVFALAFAARRVFPKHHAVRKASVAAAVLIVTEALLGAGLVLFDYVAHNASAGRAAYLSLHLVNTQLLLASLFTTAWLARRDESALPRVRPLLWAALCAALVVSITGAIAALGDTLFPATSLAAGMSQDFSSAASGLLRLRIIHPAIAVIASVLILYSALRSLRGTTAAGTRRAAQCVLLLVFAQLCVGAVNIALLAPVFMQIGHLLVADLLWLALVALALEGGNITRSAGVLGSRMA